MGRDSLVPHTPSNLWYLHASSKEAITTKPFSALPVSSLLSTLSSWILSTEVEPALSTPYLPPLLLVCLFTVSPSLSFGWD